MSLGALYDPTLLPPVDGLSSSSSSSCGHGDHMRRNEQNSVNNGVPRAVLFLLEFQGELLHERTFTIFLWQCQIAALRCWDDADVVWNLWDLTAYIEVICCNIVALFTLNVLHRADRIIILYIKITIWLLEGRYLRDLDPELWNHLRANDIHPQFFGLRCVCVCVCVRSLTLALALTLSLVPAVNTTSSNICSECTSIHVVREKVKCSTFLILIMGAKAFCCIRSPLPTTLPHPVMTSCSCSWSEVTQCCDDVIRWSRLLLGREFRFADTHVLRIWDCLFSADAVDSTERDHLNGASQGLTNGAGAGAVAVAGYPPMLTALREFMLAMLIHVSTVTRYYART